MSDNEKNEKPKLVKVIRRGHYVSPTGGDWEIQIKPGAFDVPSEKERD